MGQELLHDSELTFAVAAFATWPGPGFQYILALPEALHPLLEFATQEQAPPLVELLPLQDYRLQFQGSNLALEQARMLQEEDLHPESKQ